MEPGECVARRFEILELVGSGGMGEVFRALDRESGGPVAIKKLTLPGLGLAAQTRSVTERRDRFEQEAAILAELCHPHIVRHVAHGTTDDGELFLAMEWLEGESLDARLRRGSLSIPEAVELAIAISEAAGAAHDLGVVHRDIKPGNVFLCEAQTSRAKLLDFGVARMGARRGPTRLGTTIGTPAYMAPEQARGAAGIDARADVFSIGCVLFECVTGQPPLHAENALALLAKILLETPPRARDLNPLVPEVLDDAITSAIAKEPERRPADGRAFAQALRAYHDAETTLALPTQSMPPGHSTRPPGSAGGLTSEEQRLLGVVLASQPASADDTDGGTTAAMADRSTGDIESELAQFGGRLERLADGSAVVTVHSDRGVTAQAAQVARCALALRSRAPDLEIAVATGRGTIAAGFPIGEVIERAAQRLNDDVHDGRILLDDVTASLLEDRFVIDRDARGAFLRGGLASVGAGPVSVRRTRCVGRDGVIRRLSTAMAACVDDSRATAVLITGAAGIGKSRVLEEAVRTGQARFVTWSARGNPMAPGSPYGIVTELLRCFVDSGESSSSRTLAQALTARVSTLFSGADRERLVEFFAELCGAPVEHPSVALQAARRDHLLMGDQLRRAFSDLCVRVAGEHPLMWVLEDLQWGDIPSLRCIEDTLARAGELPLFVVGLTRPDHLETLLGGLRERVGVDLTLSALTRRASVDLVRDALGPDAADEVVSGIVERAEHNPFFLHELAHAARAGRFDEVPETVLAVVQGRLEQLAPERRRILRAASVFGPSFTSGGVEALLGGEPAGAALERELRAMIGDDLITTGGVSRTGAALYSLSHHLVREAAYRMLTDRDRELGHQLAAQWLIETGDADPLALATHLERSGEPERAVGWYRSSAEQALGGSDLGAVLVRAERGLACGAAGEERGVLCLVAAEAHNWLGQTTDGLALARAAVDALPPTSPLRWRAEGEVASCLGKMAAYDELADRAASFDQSIPPDSAGAAVIAAVRTLVNLLQAGRLEPAERLLERAKALRETVGEHEPASTGWLFRARASHALHRGDPDAYRRYNEQAAASFEAIGDLRNAAMPKVNVGYGYCLIGAYSDAVATLREALSVAQRLGLSSIESFAHVNLILPLARIGRIADAREVGERTVALARTQNNPRLEGFAFVYLALAALEGRDPSAAVAHARSAITAAEKIAPVRIHARGVLIRALLRQGEVSVARAEASVVESELSSVGSSDTGEPLVRLACVEAFAAADEPDEARRRAVAACDRLIDSAARIADAAFRERFLAQVPEHARTLELAHELSRPRDSG